MQLSDFLDFDSIRTNLSAGNKRSLLQQISNLAGNKLDLNGADILASVSEREKLGSTGFGNGVAIPHGKTVTEDVSAPQGRDLYFMCVFHPQMQGKISVR